MQRELIFSLVEDAQFVDQSGTARFNVIREINIRQLNEYMLSDDGVYDLNYFNLYGSWFTVLKSGL